ncbi:ATP synthase subunit delta, mitochondrial [Phlebotomus argentipes]|uniref:ATP synthase subunit delta, mitochondrial n=1 Tax=Phlebotomus argentipes TaxID=94469 RepID=UPI00289313E4|nr:ATP synthase subunit delta, mitochondrial [Phlebotomus argentipes]
MPLLLRGARMLATRGARLMQSRGYADEMKLTFAAANQVFYDDLEVRQIDVPTFSGHFGILPKHVPTLAVLQPGVVQVYEKDGSSKKFFVSSGTVTVNNDSSVQVLAEEAHPVESLDISAAREVLQTSQQELSSAQGDVAKAEAAIAVEVSEALVKAAQ